MKILKCGFLLLFIASISQAYSGPELKMPMQPGDPILCTVEAGGATMWDGVVDGYHTGKGYFALDFDDRYSGESIVAVAGGTVTKVNNGGTGCYQGTYDAAKGKCTDVGVDCYVIIDHGNGYTTNYHHMQDGSIQVEENQTISQGQVIGTMGTTGCSTGVHLHFSLKHNGDGSDGNENLEGVELDGTVFEDYAAGSSYSSTNDVDTTTCTSETVGDFILAVAKDEDPYRVYTWYQTSDYSSLSLYGSVADFSAFSSSQVKPWFIGEVSHDDFDDLVTSVEVDSTRYFYVFRATGDGGFYSAESWYSESESDVDKVFLGDTDGDELADLIIGNKNSSDDYNWKICVSDGSRFTNCTDWDNNDESDGTFANADDVLLMADLNGNDTVTLVRGREQDTADCTGKLKWKQLKQNGDSETIHECWGYPEEAGAEGYEAQYMAGDVDQDGADDVINIRIDTASGQVEAFWGKYNSTTDTLDTDDWAAAGTDIEGENGWYYPAYINQDDDDDYDDDYVDLVRWGDEGNLKWMENVVGVLDNDKFDLPQSSDDYLLFGFLGQKTEEVCSDSGIYITATTTDSGSSYMEAYDTDGDGLTDEEEWTLGTDADSADTDGDGLSDSDENSRGTNPLDSDSDDDGLNDYQEVVYGTDPNDSDSDDDYIADGLEVERGTNPLTYNDVLTPILAVIFAGDDDDDGYDAEDDGGDDCDDTDADIHPAATEACDGVDNNCDDSVDPDCDNDGDGLTNSQEIDEGSNPDDASSTACVPPSSGTEWFVTHSCTFTNSKTHDGDVTIQNNAVMTIPYGITLDLDFTTYKLVVENGSGVLIQQGGRLY